MKNQIRKTLTLVIIGLSLVVCHYNVAVADEKLKYLEIRLDGKTIATAYRKEKVSSQPDSIWSYLNMNFVAFRKVLPKPTKGKTITLNGKVEIRLLWPNGKALDSVELNHLTLEYTNPSSSSWKEARWHIDDKERARIRKVFGSKQKEIGVLGPDGQTMWYDAKLLGVEGKGWVDTESYYDRLPQKAKHTVRKPVWNLNHHTAGMLIRFATDAKKLQVRWTLTNKRLAMPHMPATGVSGIDLYARDQLGILRFSANGRPTEVTNKASFMLPASKEYVLYLPLYNGVKLLEIGITKEKSLSKVPSPSHSIVFYGTSITQGACASRPGMAATSMVGRRLGVSVMNLGFSGNGKMEKEMAELLTELDPDIYVLDCLRNMTLEMISTRVEPFIRVLRKTRPETPIVLAEDPSFRDLPTARGDALRKIYAELVGQGDENLYILPNKGMMGEDSDGTVDGTHPNDLGMSRQAAVFIKYLKPILKKKSNSLDRGDKK